MLILISMGTLVMELDLIEDQVFHFQVVDLVKIKKTILDNNNKKDILVLRKGPKKGLEHTLTAEKVYSINFTVTKNRFCLSFHYNEANS